MTLAENSIFAKKAKQLPAPARNPDELDPIVLDAVSQWSATKRENEQLKIKLQQAENDLNVARAVQSELQHQLDVARNAESQYSRFCATVIAHFSHIAASVHATKSEALHLMKQFPTEVKESALEASTKDIDTVTAEIAKLANANGRDVANLDDQPRSPRAG